VASGKPGELCEELGDLLLQIVFMAKIACEKEWFDFDDVCSGIADKMVRRHPHVFADREVEGTSEVLRNWEEIKQGEKAKKGKRSTMDGVPHSLPALLKAFRMTEKASAVGFDWRRPADVIVKLREEVGELEDEVGSGDATAVDRVRAEMGDTLFVMANLARHLGVEPETALQGSNLKFLQRFRGMEELAEQEGHALADLSLDELDELWERVKRIQNSEFNI
jgi:MazG family protein